MRARSLLVGVVVGSIVVTSAMVGTGATQELAQTPNPQLSFSRLIRTSLFPAPNRLFDNEGSAYVAGDDALWMADDQSDALFEVDRTTGALRRKIPQSAFINALQFGGGGSAGQSRNEDIEALAYDADADVLYAFSGSTRFFVNSVPTPSDPTVYRLTRDINDQFQVESWQAVDSESAGAGWRSADGLTYVANRSTIRTYDYPTNTFGAPFSILGLSQILGVDFDDETGDLLAVDNTERLFRASMDAPRALRAGWNGISLTGLGLLNTTAVEVIGEQVLVTDGADAPALDGTCATTCRPASDPRSHAVFVLTTARPDARIRRGAGPLVGNDIYNTTGAGQTRTGSAARGQSVTFYASIQNDAAFAETLRLRGEGSTTRFAVAYRNPAGTNITNQVTAGTYTTPNLAPGGTHRVTIIVTVRNTAPDNASLIRTLTATSNDRIKDTVKFITRRT
jgi:hypothetical protein